MMMELAGLSFLGLGVKPPMAEWGKYDQRWKKYAADFTMDGTLRREWRFLLQ